ncbi:MAG: hypothetical protein JWO70_4337 [Betaproteobacteria bacterium]|nr:hypothetical protein [Betaproteobacteria bacterium]
MSEGDLSAGTIPPSQQAFADEELQTARDSNKFKRGFFNLALCLIVLLYIALVTYVFLYTADDQAERIGITAILATVPTLLAVALIRHLFQYAPKKDEKDYMSMWFGLFKEALKIWKEKP